MCLFSTTSNNGNLVMVYCSHLNVTRAPSKLNEYQFIDKICMFRIQQVKRMTTLIKKTAILKF